MDKRQVGAVLCCQNGKLCQTGNKFSLENQNQNNSKKKKIQFND